MTKKIISLTLILLFTLQIISPLGMIFVLKQQIKKEIKQKLKSEVNSNDLVQFDSKLLEKATWIKPNKEFRIEGQMYDIVKIENGITFCIPDFLEQQLFQNLEDFLNSKNTQSPLKQVLSKIFNLVTELLPNFEFLNFNFIEIQKYFIFNENFNFLTISQIEIPPRH